MNSLRDLFSVSAPPRLISTTNVLNGSSGLLCKDDISSSILSFSPSFFLTGVVFAQSSLRAVMPNRATVAKKGIKKT